MCVLHIIILMLSFFMIVEPFRKNNSSSLLFNMLQGGKRAGDVMLTLQEEGSVVSTQHQKNRYISNERKEICKINFPSPDEPTVHIIL